MFYLLAQDEEHRDYLKEKGVHAVFHYQSLHRSRYGSEVSEACECPNADFYTEALLRLPLYGDLVCEQVETISVELVCFTRLAIDG